MRGIKIVQMSIDPVAVVSLRDGSVDVIVQFQDIGEVYCHVEKLSPISFDLTIWKVENPEPFTNFTPQGLVDFKSGVHEFCMGMVKHCRSAPWDWVVVGQETEYEVLMLKSRIDQALMDHSKGFTARFPLFKEFAN